MNPTKRERIAMQAKEIEELKAVTTAMAAEIKTLTDDKAALQSKLDAATPLHGNGQYPVKVEYRTDPVLEHKLKKLEAQLIAAQDKLALLKWQPIETSPENHAILVKFDNAINDLGDTHVMIRRGMWWYSADSYGGRRLAPPSYWREIPE